MVTCACAMRYSMIQFKEKIQWFNSRGKNIGTMDQERDQHLQCRRERERASETAEKPEGRPVENAKRSSC